MSPTQKRTLIIDVYDFALPNVNKTSVIGLLKSLVYAFIIIGITDVAGKYRIKL
jgi:heparan-alpha-glucosaminide N-acetyltransferase